ncbi:hypothetical protein GF336_00040 [Candidatus Woesearchaeota archaeon]|nr:hypothetical protein [Candidatus Woesearchaeota archaeon]
MHIFAKDRTLYEKIQLSITHLLRLTLAIAIFFEIINQRWTLLFSTVLILMITFIPLIVEKKYKIHLPVEFTFGIIVFIYLSLFLGSVRKYYIYFWWWDGLLHTGSGITLGFAGFIILYMLYRSRKMKANPFWFALFSFFFAIGIGALWEIFEFGMDQIFGMNMQETGLVDTMWDLIVDSLGALLVAVVGFFYFKYERESLFSRLLNKFIKSNPRFFSKMQKQKTYKYQKIQNNKHK